MLSCRASLRNIVLSSVMLVLIAGFVYAENPDVSLMVSVEASKSYGVGYHVGLVATIHNVTVSGRLENTSNGSGIQSQDISIYYKNASSRWPLSNISDWEFVSNASTNAEGYFIYVWIPPVTIFLNPEEHEVVYQIKVVWEHFGLEALDFADVYISYLEYERPSLMFYFSTPLMYTGLLLLGAVLFSIYIFKSYGGTDKITEKSRFDKKALVYLVLFLSFLLITFSAWLIPLPQLSFTLPLLYVYLFLIPIILLVSIPRFFRYLRRGNKLKTVVSFVVIAWSAFLTLLFVLMFSGSWQLLSSFFPHPDFYVPIHIFVYCGFSACFILALFLLLVFLKEERTVPSV